MVDMTTEELLVEIRRNKTTDWYDTVKILGITCRQSILKAHLQRLHSSNYCDLRVIASKNQGLQILCIEVKLLASFPQVDKKYHGDVQEE